MKLAEIVTKNSRIVNGVSLNLSESSSEFLLSSDAGLDSSTSEGLIKGIHNQIVREKNINSMQQESEEFFLSATNGKDVTSLLDSLKKAQKRIEKWKSQGGIERRLERIKEATSNMEQEDKTSLEDLFAIQTQLKKFTTNLITKLKDTNPTSEINLGTSPLWRSKYSLEEVQKALDWIEWDKEKIKFRVKYLDDNEKVIFSYGDDEKFSYGWGSWEKNPFRYFFESQALYKMSMERVIKAEKALTDFLAGQSVVKIVTTKIEDAKTAEKSNAEKKFRMDVAEAKLDFEMQVTSKLIEWTIPVSMKLTNS